MFSLFWKWTLRKQGNIIRSIMLLTKQHVRYSMLILLYVMWGKAFFLIGDTTWRMLPDCLTKDHRNIAVGIHFGQFYGLRVWLIDSKFVAAAFLDINITNEKYEASKRKQWLLFWMSILECTSTRMYEMIRRLLNEWNANVVFVFKAIIGGYAIVLSVRQ